MRSSVFERDGFTCQFCSATLTADKLTIDHLIPLSRGGLDEMTNWVTACLPCNNRKSNEPLESFAASIQISIESLPVHGDPVIDNPDLPIEIRLVRKRVFDRIRAGVVRLPGKSAQQRIEKEYRRSFWETDIGKQLEAEMPLLPGHVRIMIPEIRTIATSERDYLLLVELAKSASTRNLIGTVLVAGTDIEQRVRQLVERTRDAAMVKRLNSSLDRFERELRRRGLPIDKDAG